MATGPKDFSRKWGPLPVYVWVLIAGVGLYVLAQLRSRSASSSAAYTGATSVTDSPNSPNATVISMGHAVSQNLPAGQVTPNEGSGTAPILNNSGSIQYGGK